MIFIKDYKDVKDKLVYVNKNVVELEGKDKKIYKIYRNINKDFFQFDYYFNKLQESQDYFFELRFDKETKGIFKTLFVDKKKEIDNTIVFEESEEEEKSEIFEFNLTKIYSYNDFFKVNKSGKTYYNELRNVYKEEIKEQFLKNRELLKYLEFERIEIELDFIINYSQKDIDNITKPFIDILYSICNLKNDNNICKLISSKHKNNESNEECVLVRVSKILKKDYQKTLLNDFLANKC